MKHDELIREVYDYIDIATAILDDIQIRHIEVERAIFEGLEKQALYLISEVKRATRDYRTIELLELEQLLYTFRILRNSENPENTLYDLEIIKRIVQDDMAQFINIEDFFND